MSDLAVGAIAGGAGFVVAVLAVLVLALRLSTSKDDNRDLAVENAELKAQARIDAGTINRISDELKREQGVSDAIEDAAVRDPGPVDGAFDRLLSEGAAVPDPTRPTGG